MIAALVTAGYGWRATFLLGAVLSLVTVSAMAAVLPESIDYLAARRPAGALARMNTILARMSITPLDALPAPVDRAATGVGRNVLHGRNGIRSVLLWVAFFCLFAATYFAGSWTPRLLEQSSSTPDGPAAACSRCSRRPSSLRPSPLQSPADRTWCRDPVSGRRCRPEVGARSP